MPDPVIARPSVPVPLSSGRDQALRDAAVALEAGFLSEMLKSAGLQPMGGAFGGGAGEEQFASFLRAEQARAMAEAGGIGLAERLFQALAGRSDGAS